jgi:hypothetical protein
MKSAIRPRRIKVEAIRRYEVRKYRRSDIGDRGEIRFDKKKIKNQILNIKMTN